MPIDAEELAMISRNVCETLLTVNADLVPDVRPDPGPTRTAYTLIDGQWNGLVAVTCPSDVSRRLASAMFGRPAAAVSEHDLDDAVLELANMIGGNVKAFMPGPSRLSIPQLLHGDVARVHPVTDRLADLQFSVGGRPVGVRVFGRAA